MADTRVRLNIQKGKVLKEIPLLVIISFIVAGITYNFFTPWYVRLWNKFKKRVKRILRVERRQP